jgi:RimJ/RimL family protein N-acetyltransferase
MPAPLQPLTTDRLLLRPFVGEDAEPAFAIFGDAEVMRYSLSGRDVDLAATRSRLTRIAAHCAEHGFGSWAVTRRSDGAIVGICGIVRSPVGGDFEIAYRLRRDCWGHGYAAEAARAWLDRAFSTLGLTRIVAFIEPSNHASQRVIARLGMRYDQDLLYQGIAVQRYVIERASAD